jgi:hypothetical protein
MLKFQHNQHFLQISAIVYHKSNTFLVCRDQLQSACFTKKKTKCLLFKNKVIIILQLHHFPA